MNVSEREFLSFVAGLFGVPAETLSLGTAYGSLSAWDSVMHLRLVMEVEGEYGVSFALEEIPDLKTLGDVYARLKS